TWIATVLWLGGSLAIKYYAANLAHYNVAYGSIGAVVVLLLWFYWTGIAILLGAEIDASRLGLERRLPP
ncbi:MAG: YihY/virulence factor BrkB family protein, partial [Pseudomonadota bacterium]|nr:YihY/virulence factor BrkB family protein [Pseudomonadota bacterium]